MHGLGINCDGGGGGDQEDEKRNQYWEIRCQVRFQKRTDDGNMY